MSQIAVRRWHRRVGIAIALFVILQAGTGLMLEWENSWLDRSAHEPPHEHEPGLAATIHHGALLAAARPLVSSYRLVLAAGLIWMALSGGFMFFQTRTAARRRGLWAR